MRKKINILIATIMITLVAIGIQYNTQEISYRISDFYIQEDYKNSFKSIKEYKNISKNMIEICNKNSDLKSIQLNKKSTTYIVL